MRKFCFLFFTMSSFLLSVPMSAQQQGFVHETSSEYTAPEDPAVIEKLEQWRDLKFGVLIHWGLYSVPGIVESWSICSEDVDWIRRRDDMSYDEYKQWYWGLKDIFNPVDFDPEAWAEMIAGAGARYAIFTSKHHDGFCMFDTDETDFSIASGPFGENEKADVLKHVLNAFRHNGIMPGVYFSKPDWHCPYYWDPHYATPDRHVNYVIDRHPESWQKYSEYTKRQINELTTRYGDIDILWLDGGWVAAPDEDIDMDGIVAMARRNQPGLITVDRTVRGKNENYLTPERSIPKTQLPYPWESCITMTNDWGWVPDAQYKSSAKIISLLSEVVAKGGCLLLGIGPDAKGVFEDKVADTMAEIGRWLDVNGEAIYGAGVLEHYNDGLVWFTSSEDGKKVYAIQTVDDATGEIPASVNWSGNLPSGKMKLLQTGKKVGYKIEGNRVTVKLPSGVNRKEPLVFVYEL
ncbi:MAG TPA: alpha-L-fucosidase [Candidatus Avibacteroides excrementipullorum]|nr:alpha-L-fucosidase [Candidatus Avibacteroides excrementipullorum]